MFSRQGVYVGTIRTHYRRQGGSVAGHTGANVDLVKFRHNLSPGHVGIVNFRIAQKDDSFERRRQNPPPTIVPSSLLDVSALCAPISLLLITCGCLTWSVISK